MKRIRWTTLVAAAVLVAALPACAADKTAAAKTVDPQTEDEKTLYALGLTIASQLKVFRLTEAETALVQAGLADGIAGRPAKVELEAYGPKIGPLAEARALASAGDNKNEGKAYAEKAAKESGANRTASGLVYTVVTEGTGESPKASDTVQVHYRGTLIDGTEFDSSYKRNQPASFSLGQVIPCWTEGLQFLKVGGKAKLVCPSEIAYGDRGRPPTIPPGATLLFDVELLDIVK